MLLYVCPARLYVKILRNINVKLLLVMLILMLLFNVSCVSFCCVYDRADGSGPNEQMQAIDYVVIALFFVALVAGTAYLIKRMFFTKVVRRRLSLEGEKVAQRTVEKMASPGNSDGHDMDHLHDVEQHEYYRYVR
jgi:hypothetical protein